MGEEIEKCWLERANKEIHTEMELKDFMDEIRQYCMSLYSNTELLYKLSEASAVASIVAAGRVTGQMLTHNQFERAVNKAKEILLKYE